MKELIKSTPSVFKQREKSRNILRFLRFALVLFLFVGIYMYVYRNLMEAERQASVGLVECFYWVLTTMSTLGYGDITFKGDAGRLFSMVVMFTGVFYLFIVLPFVFMEFLYKPFKKNFYIGYEYHDVKRRTYDQRFKFFDYKVKTQHINMMYHHRHSGIIIKSSYGKYLAGDKGFTLDLSRKTKSGFQAGFYFTRTDVPAALFGEGSFDKGFYFKIPNSLLGKSLDKTVTSFALSPLTRDGGQKLDITNRLIDIIQNDQLFSIDGGWNGFLK